MEWPQFASAVLAGGLVGQLITLIWNNRAKSKQDLDNWLRTERYKAFVELLALVSASAPRDDYDRWPTDIRNACQKVHMLCPGGIAPHNLTDSMEKVFQLARKKKHGEVQDHDAWTNAIREEARLLRVELSKFLHSTQL
jgi:hypothetical protein